MKIIVLVPSEEYRSYAGARIRYGRLAPELAASGVDLALVDIARFDPSSTDYDLVLISKCHDARSLILAAAVSARGKLVGFDLFDDYFSQEDDSRLTRYRAWLRQLAPVCDFALCSTSVMVEVIAKYRRGLPVYVMNDPAPEHDTNSLERIVAKKVADALNLQRLRVAWFGIGDNPYFPVGLTDLAAHGAAVMELSASGMAVELTILTNRRALTADGLALIRQLPIAAEVSEWTERAEHDLLREALVAFLPVNASSFSRGKSLNRAFTALSSGCQVLSVGYPLYSALEPLIYRESAELAADLVRGSLRFSAATASKYREKLEVLASARTEARNLVAFLATLKGAENNGSLLLAAIHGQSTREETHALVRKVSGLSVASPFCAATLDFDVIFRGSPDQLTMLISQRASPRLLPHVRAKLKGRARFHNEQYLCVQADSLRTPVAIRSVDLADEPIPFQLATYASMMDEVERRIIDAFGPCRTFVSEISRLPFPLAARAA